MTDLRSEGWLWFKGIAFACVATLSFFLVLVELKSSKQVLLVLVSIWAFCRAYYFAFYVIEKYIDRQYRFAGLIYVPQYIANRWSGEKQDSKDSGHFDSDQTLSWWVFWPHVFLISDLVIPASFNALGPYQMGEPIATLTDTLLYSLGSLQVGYLGVWTTFAPLGLRYRVSIGLCLLWLSMLFVMIGLGFFEIQGIATAAVLLTLYFVVVVIALHATSYLTGKRFMYASESGPTNATYDLDEQLQLRDILILTTMIAVIFGMLQFFPKIRLLLWTFFTGTDNVVLIFLFLAMAIFLVVLLQALLELFAGEWSRSRMLALTGLIVLMLVAFPPFSLWLQRIALQNGAVNPSMRWQFLGAYVATFAFGWSMMLLHGRRRGLRYLRPNRTFM